MGRLGCLENACFAPRVVRRLHGRGRCQFQGYGGRLRVILVTRSHAIGNRSFEDDGVAAFLMVGGFPVFPNVHRGHGWLGASFRRCAARAHVICGSGFGFPSEGLYHCVDTLLVLVLADLARPELPPEHRAYERQSRIMDVGLQRRSLAACIRWRARGIGLSVGRSSVTGWQGMARGSQDCQRIIGL